MPKKYKEPVEEESIIEDAEEALNSEIETKDNKETDAYEEHGCEFVNEAECEEELEEDGLEIEEVEKEHFEEEESA